VFAGLVEIDSWNFRKETFIVPLQRIWSIDKGYWDLIERVSDAMVLSDFEGRIVCTNTNTLRMFGYSSDELVGREIEIFGTGAVAAAAQHGEKHGSFGDLLHDFVRKNVVSLELLVPPDPHPAAQPHI